MADNLDQVRDSARKNATSERTTREATEHRPSEVSLREKARRNIEEFDQNVLPKLPTIDGYHLVWVSTTNRYDSVNNYFKMGYSLVKQSEISAKDSDFSAYVSVTEGEYAGGIIASEMLMLKVPSEMYQEYMHYYHRELPDQLEGSLSDKQSDLMQESKHVFIDKDQAGGLSKRTKAPKSRFAE